MTEINQYVTFGIASELLAIPVSQVREILELQPTARLPGAPPYLLGMIDVRGQGVPVIDLRIKLGFGPNEDTENTRIVVLNTLVEDQGGVIGIKVDRVFEVTTLDASKLVPLPTKAVRWRAEFIVGIGRRNGDFVTVLDLGSIFNSDELAVFEAA